MSSDSSQFEGFAEVRRLKAECLARRQESSAEVVQEALRLGACGYVKKLKAAKDLLAAVEAVISGNQFVSSP